MRVPLRERSSGRSDLRAALKQNHKELQPAQIRWQAYRDEEKRLQTAAPPRKPFARIGARLMDLESQMAELYDAARQAVADHSDPDGRAGRTRS